MSNNIEALFEAIDDMAKREWDGHWTIFSFTTGFKGAFATPLEGHERASLWALPSFTRLEDLLAWMIAEKVSFYDCESFPSDLWKH